MPALTDRDEPTQILGAGGPDPTATADGAQAQMLDLAALADSSAKGADMARAWFDTRLRAFVDALGHDHTGRTRTDTERQALGIAARDMIERLSRPPAPSWSPDATLQPGQLLANTYFVRALIARGGVGEIYRVRHRDLGTEQAVKILQPRHTLNTTLTAMLLEEGRFLSRVRHPGVVAGQGLIRDADGRLLLVMEFIRGRTLAARLREGPLSPEEMTALTTGLVAALGAVHAEHVLHGDLSPDNIMLVDDRCESPKLIDFGLAQATDGEDVAPVVDFAGKFSWIAPEQLEGRRADARADLYSLGLVLAASLHGRRLDMGSDRAGAAAARLQVPALGDVPAPWLGLLTSLLAPDPADRPRSAAAVLSALAPPPKRRRWWHRR